MSLGPDRGASIAVLGKASPADPGLPREGWTGGRECRRLFEEGWLGRGGRREPSGNGAVGLKEEFFFLSWDRLEHTAFTCFCGSGRVQLTVSDTS